MLESWYNTGSITCAKADIKGGPIRPELLGTVWFKDVCGLGTQVCVEVWGLPPYRPAEDGQSPIGPFGFHIHEFGDCQVGNSEELFKGAGGHWNPTHQPHGNHAGDFPVIFSNNGYAHMCFYTDKFLVKDIIGRSVIIHQNPDDYRTQPAGNSGKRMACGVIEGV